MNKKAIIVGITGQDGPYLSTLLLDKGYNVYGITRSLSNYNNTNLKYLGIESKVEIIELSCLEKEGIAALLQKIKPDEIYNLASQSSVGHSFVDPFSTLSYNILSVLNWLEGIKATDKAIRFYQASSSEMFGNVPEDLLPMRENLRFHPASPYGVSKAAAHWLAVNYRESNGIYAACGILFNHESPLRGKNYVVKKVISTAIKIKKGLLKDPLVVGNLDVQRDWGYAPEYVKAMWLMLQQDEPGDYLICSGNVMSLRELVEMIFDKLDLDKEKFLIQDPALFRPVDLAVIYGDNTKAKAELGWDYEMSNDELITKLISDETQFIEWELRQN